ncbi:MAG: hypothetical protein KAX26_07575 [Anaerolineae bacterium]|nr:hypothetical protein [Anaerolineae bacterium]
MKGSSLPTAVISPQATNVATTAASNRAIKVRFSSPEMDDMRPTTRARRKATSPIVPPLPHAVRLQPLPHSAVAQGGNQARAAQEERGHHYHTQHGDQRCQANHHRRVAGGGQCGEQPVAQCQPQGFFFLLHQVGQGIELDDQPGQAQ